MEGQGNHYNPAFYYFSLTNINKIQIEIDLTGKMLYYY